MEQKVSVYGELAFLSWKACFRCFEKALSCSTAVLRRRTRLRSFCSLQLLQQAVDDGSCPEHQRGREQVQSECAARSVEAYAGEDRSTPLEPASTYRPGSTMSRYSPSRRWHYHNTLSAVLPKRYRERTIVTLFGKSVRSGWESVE